MSRSKESPVSSPAAPYKTLSTGVPSSVKLNPSHSQPKALKTAPSYRDHCTTVTSGPKTRSTERRNRNLHKVNEDSEYRATPYLGRAVGCAEVSYRLRRSTIHGTGVFATRKILQGTRILEYQGERITARESERRHPVNPDDPYHTFFFALDNGKVIDGGVGGNESRFINHACDPNCEGEEDSEGRIWIRALKDIPRGAELTYDYNLIIDVPRLTASLKAAYRCLCGAKNCRHTMLGLKHKRRQKLSHRSKT